MNVFLIAFSTIAIAEMGDRTQLLSLVLSAKFCKPWAIIAGIFLATLANHALAGLLGVWLGRYLTPVMLDGVVGVSMIAMAAWTLIPDKLDAETKVAGRGAFLATLIAFFVAEIGDKTQIATSRSLPVIPTFSRLWAAPRPACWRPTFRWCCWAPRLPPACR